MPLAVHRTMFSPMGQYKYDVINPNLFAQRVRQNHVIALFLDDHCRLPWSMPRHRYVPFDTGRARSCQLVLNLDLNRILPIPLGQIAQILVRITPSNTIRPASIWPKPPMPRASVRSILAINVL